MGPGRATSGPWAGTAGTPYGVETYAGTDRIARVRSLDPAGKDEGWPQVADVIAAIDGGEK